MARFVRHLFPWIDDCPIGVLTVPEVLKVLRRIESRGALDTAHRALGNCGAVFRYAIATERGESDPTRDLRGSLPPIKEGHFAAVTDMSKVSPMLRSNYG